MGNSLEVKWLGLRAFIAMAWVQFCKQYGAAKKKDWWVIIRAASPFSQGLGVGVQNFIIPPED